MPSCGERKGEGGGGGSDKEGSTVCTCELPTTHKKWKIEVWSAKLGDGAIPASWHALLTTDSKLP